MERNLSYYQQNAAFRDALRGFLRTSEQVARRNGLTPQRHLLLLMVKGAPDGSESATVGDLVKRLHLNQSTVTELVSRSEAAGLLQRKRDQEDRRVVHVSLTSKGDRQLRKVVKELEESREQLRRALDEHVSLS